MLRNEKPIRPVEVEPRGEYRIWIRYSDGASGELDLSDLAGRGVFAVWADGSSFESVHLSPAGGIAWHGDLELCPDAVYMRLTGKATEEVIPGIRSVPASA